MNLSVFTSQNLDQSLRQAWFPHALLYDGLAQAFAETVRRRQSSTVRHTHPDTLQATTTHFPARHGILPTFF